MSKQFLMGNEAIGLGALHAGVNLVAGYPGTPSTEILETIAKLKAEVSPSTYVEWSVNEKAGLEVAAGASYAGARTLVTMKQVGLNVAADPLMSLAYVGIKGGMVVVAADDPGPISSQTEQDTRTFAMFAKLPVFDPSSPEEAYEMIQEAFDYSEKYKTPVLFRPTTRVCHGCAAIEVLDAPKKHEPEGFIKDTKKWVIFPRSSYLNHLKIEERNPQIGDAFSDSPLNQLTGCGKKGIAAGGISYAYVMEALSGCKCGKECDISCGKDTADCAEAGLPCKVFKVGTPFPFPEKLALKFLEGLDEVLVIEELDPVIERALIFICGKYHLNVTIKGKLSGATAAAGENTVESCASYLESFLGCEGTCSCGCTDGICGVHALSGTADSTDDKVKSMPMPELPVRPPVLCAGCPHRASFYAVKQAMKGKKAVFSGDIGCYTLGNAMPLDMVDTCLCMGAGITIAQGLHRIEPDAVNFAFVGDSTFFASGMTGIVNAVYNETDIVLIVLDNATTAMTGHQVHPGTGKTMMGNIVEKVSIEKILKAIGISYVKTVNPLDLKTAVETVKEAAEQSGVKVIIFQSPCIALMKPAPKLAVDEKKCINCQKCIKELGCPAVVKAGEKVRIDADLCYGCGICAGVCPTGAISIETKEDTKGGAAHE